MHRKLPSLARSITTESPPPKAASRKFVVGRISTVIKPDLITKANLNEKLRLQPMKTDPSPYMEDWRLKFAKQSPEPKRRKRRSINRVLKLGKIL